MAICNCQLGTFNLIRINEMGVHTAGWFAASHAMSRLEAAAFQLSGFAWRLKGRVSFSSSSEKSRLEARGVGDREVAELLGEDAGFIVMQDM
jgi:hypothetical protein